MTRYTIAKALSAVTFRLRVAHRVWQWKTLLYGDARWRVDHVYETESLKSFNAEDHVKMWSQRHPKFNLEVVFNSGVKASEMGNSTMYVLCMQLAPFPTPTSRERYSFDHIKETTWHHEKKYTVCRNAQLHSGLLTQFFSCLGSRGSYSLLCIPTSRKRSVMKWGRSSLYISRRRLYNTAKASVLNCKMRNWGL